MIKIYAIDFIEFNLTTIKSHGLTINFLASDNAQYMFIYEIFKKMHIYKDVQFFILKYQIKGFTTILQIRQTL